MCRIIDNKELVEYPFKLISELTYRCNLKCIYCHNPVNKTYFENELSTESWKKIISEAKELGFVMNTLTGGEPTLRKDLAELIDYSKSMGLYTKVVTNGSTITEEYARKLKDSGLDVAQVGLPSLNIRTEQIIGGSPGFLRERIDGIKNLRKYNIPVLLNVVLTRWNINEVSDIVSFAEENTITDVEFQPTFLYGRAAENTKRGELILPTKDEMIEVYNQISTIKKSTFASIRLPKMYYYHGDPMPCGWSKEGVIVITPNGLLTPCEPGSNLYPALEFDSINGRKPLAEIIDTAPALNSFNNTDYLPKICQDCSVLTKCRGGCRVTTYLMTGGFFSEDPTCSISDKRNLIDQSFSKT